MDFDDSQRCVMPKYRKKPLIVEAVKLTRTVVIKTLEGEMTGNPGDWIITGVNGEQYPCKDDVFQKSYEEVRDGDEKVP